MTSATWRDLYAHRFTFLYLVRVNLLLRYQRTTLGFAWTLLNPLVTLTITAVVFSLVLRMDLKDYAVFLLAGTLPWMCVSTTILQSVGVFINNESMLKRVYVPKLIFPASVAAGALIDSLLSAAALLLATLLLVGAKVTLHLLFLPVAYLLLFPFAFAVALVTSIATVYVRDLQFVVSHLLQLAYFLTPVLYPLELIPPKFQALYSLNPMVYYLELFRAPIYRNTLPDPAAMATAAFLGIAVLLVATVVFRRYEEQLVFRL